MLDKVINVFGWCCGTFLVLALIAAFVEAICGSL